MDAVQVIQKINSTDEGAKFFKADLHIHTPASKDYKDPKVTPEQIIEKAIQEGLNFIAITDHNSVEWCDRVITASSGKNIEVFPGVEISTKGGTLGFHVVALFDKNKPIQEIKDCLAVIGLDSKKQGDLEALASKPIEEILHEIRACGGIAIGAHAYSLKGICNGMKGNQRTEIVRDRNLNAIEINDLKNIDYFDGSDPHYQRVLACIKSSDAHSLEEIGKEFTLIRMGLPTLEGIRQAFCDPQSRIRFNSSQIHLHPSIRGMVVEDGFLDGQIFHFNDNMNTLIGGKGTGKTTAIELIRFALCSKHKSEKLKEECDEMVKGVLGNGTVNLLLETNDNEKYVISRKSDENPKIYREDGALLDIGIDNFFDFFDIECYSQGELVCISKDSTNQLRMIDRYIHFGDLFEAEANLIDKLNGNAALITQNNERVEDLKIKSEKLPSIIEKIRIIEEKGLKEHSEKQKKWEYEKILIKNIIEKTTNKIKEVQESPLFCLDEVDLDKSRLINENLVTDFREMYSELKDALITKSKEQVITELEVKLTLLADKQKEWDSKYSAQFEEFKKITEDLKSKGIDVTGYIKLEEEKNILESYKEEIDKKEKDNQGLLIERTNLLKALLSVQKEISDKRKNEIDLINEKLKDLLHIDLYREANNKEYTEWMIDCLKGSRLQREDTAKLCSAVKPLELYSVIQNKKDDCADILSSRTGISKHYFERLIQYPAFNSKLFQLQTTKLEDTLDIKLNDQGWKSLPLLSTGGKCTAILLIAMLERQIPLIIDQPEDSLDNSFIYKSIVKIIRKLKNKRQMIIVTHNANIPVLGDCEQMFVMNSNGLKGDIRLYGVIDNEDIKTTVQTILEGGAEAFKRRREKYGI